MIDDNVRQNETTVKGQPKRKEKEINKVLRKQKICCSNLVYESYRSGVMQIPFLSA